MDTVGRQFAFSSFHNLATAPETAFVSCFLGQTFQRGAVQHDGGQDRATKIRGPLEGHGG